MMKFLKKQIPFFYTLIFAFLGALLSFFLARKYTTTTTTASESVSSSGPATSASCNMTISRLKGYEYVRPLLNEEAECEASSLASLKLDITNFINNEKDAGAINGSSVFIKELSSGDWVSVYPEESFFPGSLFKLPVIISLLRMAETDPELLNKKILFQSKDVTTVPQTYTTKTLEPGKSYTIKELLTYMIAYSDNNATQLLNRNMKVEVLKKVFTDLGLTSPIIDNIPYQKYKITTKDYSKFMEALYNGAYLTIPASEYATSLLAQCNFKDGLVKELPAHIKIAHKFGESGTDEMRELHETGIIYLGNTTYLITVMTRGTNLKKLSETISHISKMAYDRMKQDS